MAVTLHTYTDTEWKNAPDHKTTPINATNLNNIESGIDNAYTDIAAVYKQQQDDLSNISQTGSTASQAISSGKYFYLNGTLVRAKTDIANGATFTENTNYEVVTAGGLNEGVIYSTSEHAIGKWIDGSVLYEKTVDFGALPNTNIKSVAHNISNLSQVIDIKGCAYNSGGSEWYPIPLAHPTNLSFNIFVVVDSTYVSIRTGSDRSSQTAYVTIRYTKTS